MTNLIMDTCAAFDLVRDHWDACTECQRNLSEAAANLSPDARDMLARCLALIVLVRGFFLDSYAWKAPEEFPNPETTRLLRLGELAKRCRAALYEIGQHRLGVSHRSRRVAEQALRELESCVRWLQRKNLSLGRVRHFVDRGNPECSGWEEIAPREYVNTIFEAIRLADRRRMELETEKKARDPCG